MVNTARKRREAKKDKDLRKELNKEFQRTVKRDKGAVLQFW